MMRKKRTGKVYRIVAQRELSDSYACAFEGMHMEAKDGRTILTGEVKDQPHLHGILNGLYGLGLELLSVQAMAEVAPRAPRGTREEATKWALATSPARLIHRSACTILHSPGPRVPETSYGPGPTH